MLTHGCSTAIQKRNAHTRTAKVVWVCSPLILDIYLNSSERIERLEHLSKKGCDVYLISTHSARPHAHKKCLLKNSSIHVISVPLRYKPLISQMLYGFILFFFLPFYLAVLRPDFIISNMSSASFLVWKPILSKLLKFKMILDVRSYPPVEKTYSGLRGSLQTILTNISVYVAKTMFDGITIVTPFMRKEICQKFNINPKSVGILPNGVSNELFTYERHIGHRRDLRKKFGLSNKFVVFYHGSFRITGGLIETVKAIALLKREYPNVTFFLLGAGPAFQLLEKTIKENGVQNQIILHEAVEYHDVPKYISVCDVGIVPLPNIPDWRYQQPLKLLEYLSMKKPVIVSDIPAHRSIIGSEKNGIYIPSVDPVEIARAIRYAYENRDKLEEWGEIGRNIVIKKYSWEKVTEDLMNYLLEK